VTFMGIGTSSLEFPESLFEAAAKVTSHFALGAFGIAAIVAIIWMISTKKGAPGKVPVLAWVVLILAIAIPTAAGVVIALSTPTEPYRVTAVVLDPDGIVVPDARVTNVAGGQRKQTNDEFEFEISRTAVPSDHKVVFYADKDGMAGEQTISLGTSRSASVSIKLKKKNESDMVPAAEPYKITALVLDANGAVVSDASVTTTTNGEVKRAGDVIEFDILPTVLPPDRKVTFFADKNGSSSQETIQLGSSRTASVVIKLQGQVAAATPLPVVESTLTPDGFTPPNLGPQIPGCECGPSTIGINPLSVNLKTDEWGQFTWDAHWICQGQGLRNSDGNVAWDARTLDKLPDSYGTARFRFRKPGAYSINLDYSAVCLDKGNGGSRCWPGGNFCKATGVARVIVQ
jgi:hypothetical protein